MSVKENELQIKTVRASDCAPSPIQMSMGNHLGILIRMQRNIAAALTATETVLMGGPLAALGYIHTFAPFARVAVYACVCVFGLQPLLELVRRCNLRISV